MRVVSFVPSWTETLIRSGVNVVGRTRFCIHPQDAISRIPVVGGTKDWKWEKVLEAKPDLLILDKEENPKFMAEQKEIKWHASHITSLCDMPLELSVLADTLKSPALESFAKRWEAVCKTSPPRADLTNLPGVLEWGRRPEKAPRQILYMIWKNPWMCVSRETFIGSSLAALGIQVPSFDQKYPQVDLTSYEPSETLLLLSSEPYPFFKKKKDFLSLEFPYAFVEGESFSWFGIRSLEFFEEQLAL